MSDLTNYPKQSYFKTVLASPIDSTQTTGIILDELFGFTIAGTVYLSLLDPTNVETISFTGQNASGELTGVTRGVATYEGETATASAHGAGISVVLSDNWNWWGDMATAFNDKVNISGDTMTGLLQFSGSSNPGIKLNNLTTAQRNALSAANGEIVYDTDLGEIYQYIGGAWSAVSAGSTQPNGSTSVAGKYQTATAAQQLAATATGSTGAQLVPVTANMVTTSAGAGDAGKIAVLNASGVFENTAMNAATTGASKTVVSKANSKLDDSLLALTTAGDTVYSDGTDLQRLAIGTAGQALVVNSGATAPSWSSINMIGLAGSFYGDLMGLLSPPWSTTDCNVTAAGGDIVATVGVTGDTFEATKLLPAANGTTAKNLQFDDNKDIIWEGRSKIENVRNDNRGGIGQNGAFLLSYNNTGLPFVGFAANTSTLYAVTSNGTSTTTTDISSGINVQQWQTYRIVYTAGTDAKFYVNGTLLATISTNLPTANADIRVGWGGTNNGQDFVVQQPYVAIEI